MRRTTTRPTKSHTITKGAANTDEADGKQEKTTGEDRLRGRLGGFLHTVGRCAYQAFHLAQEFVGQIVVARQQGVLVLNKPQLPRAQFKHAFQFE